MELLNIIVLAIVQGITEFLPVSSSGHLLLIPGLTGWKDQGLATDVMVHVGSLFAIMVYFWRDVMRLIKGGIELLMFKWTDESRLAAYIIIGTIPAVIFGLILKKTGILDGLRVGDTAFMVVGWTAIIYGTLLYLTDRYGLRINYMSDMRMSPAIIIGCAQALALIPGTSRSGITMTAARALGYERSDAARFSFLLGMPAMAGAGLLTYLELQEKGESIPVDALYAAGLTFFSAIAAITFLMALVKRYSFLPYVIYRLILGVFLLCIAYRESLGLTQFFSQFLVAAGT